MVLGFSRWSLLAKVALALFAVGLLPLALLALQLIGLNRTAMKDQVLRVHAVSARTAAERIEAFLHRYTSLAASLASHPAVAEDPGSESSADLLAGTLESEGRLAVVALLDREGKPILRAQRKDVAAELAPVLEDQDPESVFVRRGLSRTWLRIRSPFPEGSGTVVLVCNAEPLLEMLRPEEIVEEADLLLASADGRLVLGSLDSLDQVPLDLVQAAKSRKISGAGEYRGKGGEKVLGAYAPIDESSWFVLSLQPLHVAEAVARRMGWHSLLAVGSTLFLAALLSGFAYRSLVQPIRELVRAQRRLAGLSEAPKPGNEIEQLRAGFALLERRMRDNEAVGNVFLGRYKVLEVVGEGGMGTVFHAWDPKLRRDVAIKTIRFEHGASGEEQNQMISGLLNEAASAARFVHPNIVAVYDVTDSPGATFVTMEFVQGISLAKRLIALKGPLSVDQAVPMAAGVARGLEAAHGHGLVHRDIKPGNILLGQDGSIKIADFGMADFAHALAGQNDMVFGTPGYLPPESLLGKGYSLSGDLFALGVVLYACLTARLPFRGKTPEETAQRTIYGHLLPPRDVNPAIPAELEALVLHLLERDPQKRLSSATEVAETLEKMAEARGWRWGVLDLPEKDVDTDEDAQPRSRFVPTVTLVPTRQG